MNAIKEVQNNLNPLPLDHMHTAYREILPTELFQAWEETIPNWDFRWEEQAFQDTITAPTHIPQMVNLSNISPEKPDGTPKTEQEIKSEAGKKWSFGLEQWMIGGQSEIALPLAMQQAIHKIFNQTSESLDLSDPHARQELHNLLEIIDNCPPGYEHAITGMLKDQLGQLHKKITVREFDPTKIDTEKVQAELEVIAGSQVRLAWSELIGTSPELSKDLYQKMIFHTTNYAKLIELYQQQLLNNPQQLINSLQSLEDRAHSLLTRTSRQTATVFGRDDNLYFNLKHFVGKPEQKIFWTQPMLEEDPMSPEGSVKGITITLYRHNPTTGELEFFGNYGKRESSSRTASITPSAQLSFSNIIHILGSEIGQQLSQAINFGLVDKGTTQIFDGFAAVVDDANPNRLNDSAIATVAFDFDRLSPDKQTEMLEAIAAANGGQLSHAWLSEYQIQTLAVEGLYDLQGVKRPAINNFFTKGIATAQLALSPFINHERKTIALLQESVNEIISNAPEKLKAGIETLLSRTDAEELIRQAQQRGVKSIIPFANLLTLVINARRLQAIQVEAKQQIIFEKDNERLKIKEPKN